MSKDIYPESFAGGTHIALISIEKAPILVDQIAELLDVNLGARVITSGKRRLLRAIKALGLLNTDPDSDLGLILVGSTLYIAVSPNGNRPHKETHL